MKRVLIIRPIISQVYAHLHLDMDITILLTHDEYYDLAFDDELSKIRQSVRVIEFIPKNQSQSMGQYFQFLIELFRMEKFDIVFSNNLKDIPFLRYILFRYNTKDNVKIIGISHNPQTWKIFYKKIIALFVIKYFTSGFIALSNSLKNIIINYGVQPNRVIFIPNAIHLPECSFASNPKEPDFQIIYVANIEPRKAQDVIIKALQIAKLNFPGIKCKLIGRINDKNYKNHLEKLIEDTKLGENISFTGWVSLTETQRYINLCDLFVFPSKSEILPRAVIEAMWAGKPVIASQIDGITDLISNDETGILFDPGDYSMLAGKIVELFTNPQKAQRIGKNAWEAIRLQCSEQNVGNSFSKFYKQLEEFPS
jgi:glycosyltransferase involved in cell wall biosynthesis